MCVDEKKRNGRNYIHLHVKRALLHAEKNKRKSFEGVYISIYEQFQYQLLYLSHVQTLQQIRYESFPPLRKSVELYFISFIAIN